MDRRRLAGAVAAAIAPLVPALAADEASVTTSPGSSDADIVEVPLEQPAAATCTARQSAGKADPPGCTIVVVDGVWRLRIEGFDLRCDVGCSGESSVGIVALTSEQSWSFSR